jgi:hypothetical protein
MVPRAEPHSYYGQPLLKPPVWSPEVPFYFFAGGLAGASAGLAFAAGVSGNRELERRAWRNALVGLAVSPPLLIADLGRPERFLNMLRVFKVSSPMSVGSWVLALYGAATGVAAGSELTGLAPGVGRAAKLPAALLGLPLATYTAGLLSNTAVPVWHEGRMILPFHDDKSVSQHTPHSYGHWGLARRLYSARCTGAAWPICWTWWSIRCPRCPRWRRRAWRALPHGHCWHLTRAAVALSVAGAG